MSERENGTGQRLLWVIITALGALVVLGLGYVLNSLDRRIDDVRSEMRERCPLNK